MSFGRNCAILQEALSVEGVRGVFCHVFSGLHAHGSSTQHLAAHPKHSSPLLWQLRCVGVQHTAHPVAGAQPATGAHNGFGNGFLCGENHP